MLVPWRVSFLLGSGQGTSGLQGYRLKVAAWLCISEPTSASCPIAAPLQFASLVSRKGGAKDRRKNNFFLRLAQSSLSRPNWEDSAPKLEGL